MPASKTNIPGHRGNNPEAVKARQDAFLEAYDKYGTIKHACNEIRIDRSTVTSWRNRDVNGFAARMNDARDDFAEEIEYTLFQRAKDPKCNPILVMFALKGLKPDKYRDNTVVTDDTAKDVLKELRSRYKGLNFEEAPTAEEASVHEQAELILKSKRK